MFRQGIEGWRKRKQTREYNFTQAAFHGFLKKRRGASGLKWLTVRTLLYLRATLLQNAFFMKPMQKLGIFKNLFFLFATRKLFKFVFNT